MLHYDPSRNEYGYDYVIWLRKTNHLRGNIPDFLFKKRFDDLKYQIYKANDPSFAYFFVREFSKDTENMQKIIIKNKDYKYSYLFAKNIPEADVKKLQEIVIKSNKMDFVAKFACFVKNSNSNHIQKIIAKSQNTKAAYMLMRFFKKVNLSLFKDFIFKSKKPRYIFEYCKKTKNIDEIKEGQNLILNSNSYTYMRLFAQHIELADVSLFDNEIILRDNEYELFKYISYVDKSKLKNMRIFL